MIRQHYVLSVMILLMLAALACNIPAAGDHSSEPLPPTEGPPMPTPTPEPVSSAVGPEGGFTTSAPIDPAALPQLAVPGAGGELAFCEYTGEGPAITMVTITDDRQMICLVNFPTVAGSPDITLTLGIPDGESYTEIISYRQEGDRIRLVGTYGEIDAGILIPDGEYIPLDAPPSVFVEIYTPGNMMAGEWTAEASTADGSINLPETILPLSRYRPITSVLPTPETNPFYSSDKEFSTGNTIYVVGTGYAPNTPITVAFYWEEPGQFHPVHTNMPLIVAQYATTVTTDAQGNLTAEFVVGDTTRRGQFYIVAEPQITAEKWVNPMTDGFIIN
jgi:hypothetical protein